MSSLNGWGLTLTYFLVVVISLVAAKPTLKLTTSRISQCVDIEFQYGGGTPPYTFNAVAAFLPSQTLRLDQSSGTASWNCVFPRFNQATKKTTQLTFFIEDSNGDFSSATTLLDVNENPGISCSIYQDPPFQFRWSDSMGGSGPGAIVPQCKSLSLTTVMAANQNITVNLPLVLIGIVPGGDVWKTTGAPDTSELTLPLNVEAGNQVVFTMRDYQKHQGGSTDIMSVVSGTECAGGTIAGIAIGGAAALAIVCLSIFACFWWRRRTAAKKVSYAQAPVDLAEPDPYFGPNGPPMQVIRSPTDLNPNLQFQGTKLNEGHGSDIERRRVLPGGSPLPSSVRGPLSHKSVPSSFSGSLPGTAVFAIGDPTVNVNDVQPTYRIQEDAGPVPQVLASASDQIVDMPPTYNPTWSASQGRPRRQVKTPAHTTDHMGAHANDRA
ncbi:hypothetical protein CcaverHIS002_0300170 [Cutaneotrichosporon cavernicola]|nr:hypothetical protein CcaverHIS002_0300170 [Cutaneotrichosporon cavernicola]